MRAGPKLARLLYSALLRLLLPLWLGRLWWRGRAEPLYRRRLGERLGFYGDTPREAGAIWIHAVSLGETRAAAALVEALRARDPRQRLLLTHGTATGRAAGAALLRPGVDDIDQPLDRQVWLPIDTPGATRRFIEQFRPAVGVLMETEIWPNLVESTRRAGVPLILANARLSGRSAARGDRFAALLRPAVEALRLVLAQTEGDACRLRSRGAPRVEVCGNLKYDMTPSPALLARGLGWRGRARAQARPLVLAASLREGEDEPLLAAWRRHADGHARLLLVPRHPQRFDEVAERIVAQGFSLARRSSFADAADGPLPDAAALAADVWLGDTLGEMPLYYAAAEVALLGGSFAPLGGQNLIEAAACGCPVILGPHTFNFDEAANLALAAGAALRVDDLDAAVEQALRLIHTARVAGMADAARAFSLEHRGAAARMADRILAQLRR